MLEKTKSPKTSPTKRPLTKVRLYKGLIGFLDENNIDSGAPIDQVLLELGNSIRDEAVAKG